MAYHFLGIGWLSWITFLPIIGMIIVLLIPKEARSAMKWTAVGITFLQVVFAVLIYLNFNYNLSGINTQEGMQFVEKAKWIDIQGVSWFGRLRIEYFLGVDGISVPMVILTALISLIAVFASWKIEKALKGYMVMLLLLDTGMMGVFVSLDFFLFYVGVGGFDNKIVDGMVNLIAYLGGFLGLLMRKLQTGKVQTYLAFVLFGVMVFFLWFR